MRKVAVSAEGAELASRMDVHFGRAPWFVICDLETGEWEAVENPAALEARGAGIAAASFLVDRGVEGVITGHCGPKAFAVLQAAGVRVASLSGVTVEEALRRAREGRLTFLEAPNAGRHAGGGLPGRGGLGPAGGRGRGGRW